MQRTNKNRLPQERVDRLMALPGWCWDSLVAKWEDAFSYLQEFARQEGHCKVPVHYKTNNGYKLGSWVSTQRKNCDEMLPERKARLEALPGWSWHAVADTWEKAFSHLKAFVDREGHARVPSNFKLADGYSLGQWVGAQRRAKNSMSVDRKARLEALQGWAWQASGAVVE